MRTSQPTASTPARNLGRLTRPLVVATLAAAIVASGTSAAQAQSISNADSAGDMASVDYETGATAPAPDQVRNDVIKTRMTHGAYRVSIRVEYAELQRVADGGNMLVVQMVTNEGLRRILDLEALQGHWGGRTTFTRADERPVRCAVRHSIDYAKNVMSLSFPRRCASRPRWVKFRVGAATFENGLHIDDALRDRPLTDDDINLARSRRVYRATTS
jgi:hypothetical protein